MLLPCTGTWRVAWRHLDRPPPGESHSLGTLCGSGASLITIDSDGEERVLAPDPQDLDECGIGPGGEPAEDGSAGADGR